VFKKELCSYLFSKCHTDHSAVATNAGTQWRSWFRGCSTSRTVACLFPDGITGIFHWLDPSGRTMAMWSTQPLTEMSTRELFPGV